MKSKATLLKIAEIVLHVISFPLLLLVAVILNINVMTKAAQYGISGFVFVIVIALFAAIYYAAYFILIKQEKKRRLTMSKRSTSAKNLKIKVVKKADPARRTGLILAIVAVCCLTGLWAFFDIVMPKPLAEATSWTLFIEDLSDGWNERADVNQKLLDDYITRAYYAGKLQNNTLDVYLKEGVRNEEVVAVMNSDFASIDQNGYATYVGPAIDFAQNDRMTISAIVHLLMDDRTPVMKDGVRGDEKIPLTTFKVERSNPVQDSQTENDNAIIVGNTYMYLRSNGKYILYNDALDKAGTDLAGLLIYEEAKGYKKIQYLAGDPKDSSFTYVIDTYDGFSYLEQISENDKVVKESSIVAVDGGFKVHVYYADATPADLTVNGRLEKTERGQAISSGTDDVDALDAIEAANIILGATKEDLFDSVAMPANWDDTNVICLSKTKVVEYAMWDVLDMLGDDLSFDLPIASIKSIVIPGINISGETLLTDYKYLIDDVLTTVGKMISDKNIVASDIYITLDTDTGALTLTPSNVERGTLDYMSQAWLQNNGLIYIIVSLFSLRKIFLIFAGFIALFSYLIGMVREYRFADAPEAKRTSDDEILVDDLDLEDVEGTDL